MVDVAGVRESGGYFGGGGGRAVLECSTPVFFLKPSFCWKPISGRFVVLVFIARKFLKDEEVVFKQ